MDPLDDPFQAIELIIEDSPLAGGADFIFIDMHGEATSEKMAFGHNFDGRVTAILGHIHMFPLLIRWFLLRVRLIRLMLECVEITTP